MSFFLLEERSKEWDVNHFGCDVQMALVKSLLILGSVCLVRSLDVKHNMWKSLHEYVVELVLSS
jgi:hypothetical protein